MEYKYKQKRFSERFMKGQLMYVISKNATVREKPDGESEIIDMLGFGEKVGCEDLEVVNRRIKINYRIPQSRNKRTPRVHGWVPIAAMTSVKVELMFGLYYTALMDAPVFSRFHGDRIGTVSNGTRVKMRAIVGGWCLTSQGWSLTEYFRKNREIFATDDVCRELLGCWLKQAVHDWDGIYSRLRMHKYHSEDEFVNLMLELQKIEQFFRDVFMSYHLKLLYQQRAVDEEWMTRQRNRLKYLQKTGRAAIPKTEEPDGRWLDD